MLRSRMQPALGVPPRSPGGGQGPALRCTARVSRPACRAPWRRGAGHGRPDLRDSLGYLAAASALACRGGRGRRRAALLALPRPHTEDSDGWIAAASRYLSLGNEVVQQLGPTRREDLQKELAEDFEFVAPLVGPLDKASLITATAGLDIATALPDFDARYHAFRRDPDNPRRVWCQMRVRGTQTGELRFAGVTAPPSNPPTRVWNPPEAVSLTFNGAGRVREITTGYPVDRLCGTTGGLGGIFGILEGLGRPLPPPLTRTCSEIVRPLEGILGLDGELGAPEASAPAQADALPQERLLALAERLIESGFGRDASGLLADSFICTGPIGGAASKERFLEALSATNIPEAFPDIDYRWRDLRVCPFDLNRVWFTSSPVGTHTSDLRILGETLPATGRRWSGPPECGSAIFDAEGRCVYLTSGYLMDRRMGNTNGLTGVLGLREAIGLRDPKAWLARTPVQLWNSLVASS